MCNEREVWGIFEKVSEKVKSTVLRVNKKVLWVREGIFDFSIVTFWDKDRWCFLQKIADFFEIEIENFRKIKCDFFDITKHFLKIALFEVDVNFSWSLWQILIMAFYFLDPTFTKDQVSTPFHFQRSGDFSFSSTLFLW